VQERRVDRVGAVPLGDVDRVPTAVLGAVLGLGDLVGVILLADEVQRGGGVEAREDHDSADAQDGLLGLLLLEGHG